MPRPSHPRLLRRILLSAALALGAFSLVPLAADPSDDEVKAFKAAEQSYKDGAFDLCNDRVAALLKKYPKTELLPQAELLQARALYQLGRSDAAVAALNLPIDQVPENFQADTIFWQAESLLDLERWTEAEARYRTLLALKDTAGHANAANLGLAWALYKQGRQADAMPLIQGLIADKAKSPSGRQAQLMLAKINLTQKQYPAAIQALNDLLATNPEPGLAFEADYWLGETYAANGQPDKAVDAYEQITGDLQATKKPEAFPRTLVARAYLGLGRALHAQNQNDQALLAYEQAYQLTENETTQMDAFRAYLESARSSRQLPEAIARLQEFAKTSDVSAPLALFAMGSVLAEDREDDKAIGVLESLLVAYPKSSWIPAANYQLGFLYARAGKSAQAIKALQACIATSSDASLVRSAHFQLGNVLLGTKDYAGAVAQFTPIAPGNDSSAESASYNLLLALANTGKLDPFLKAEADFEKRFPKSQYLKAIARAEGRLLADAGKTDEAKTVYQNAIALPGGGPDQEALLKSLADLQYQTNDLEGTIKTCQMIVAQFPNDSLDAAQRGILVSYELKRLNDDQVEQALVALSQKYDKTPGGAEAWFRLGEFYFYRQDYVKAQDAFQQLTVNYPSSDQVDDATFFAGRAAAAHKDYAAAQTLLEKVPDGSPFKADARLWEARVFQQELKFSQAAAVADGVLATEKSGPRFVEASLLKGQCLFEMGAKDPANYALAVAALDPVVKSKQGTIAQRNEAAVRSAKCLEKMGRSEDAMALYLDVLYGRVAGDDSSTPKPPDFSWQIKAGLEAGYIRESQKDWRGAIEIYKRLEQIGGAHQQEIHDLVNKLRRDNYIYE